MLPATVRVNLGSRSYDILVVSGGLAGVGLFARQRCAGRLALVVTDQHVTTHAEQVAAALRASGFIPEVVTLAAGEGQKSLEVASQLYDRLITLKADRQTLVVPVGGGVMGDLAGFVAATYARGLALLMVPTTLLAMVDSSVGGKVAVNHPRAKNMIGAFHQPIGVWIDTDTLKTLPEREYRSGLAEVVKYGVIMDAEFFDYLDTHTTAILKRQPDAIRHVVERCCRLKADVVEKDEREETGLRAILNYGHTFAHALETAAGYSSWLHGEAVAAGMHCAALLACRRGLIGPDLVQRQRRLLQTIGLPLVPERWPIDDLLATMRADKKAVAGRMRFILPRRLGEVALFDAVSEEDVYQVLHEVIAARSTEE
jgi:3-dehydroquinate synthase